MAAIATPYFYGVVQRELTRRFHMSCARTPNMPAAGWPRPAINTLATSCANAPTIVRPGEATRLGG
jgi:hypothetical protein